MTADQVYPSHLAVAYDIAMAHVGYDKSVCILEDIVREFRVGRRILEIGVGTGECALRIHWAGFVVEDVDISGAMLVRAQEKFATHRATIDVSCANMRNLALGRMFDVVLSRGGPIRVDYTAARGYFVETYLSTRVDVERSLASISRHIVPGGLFVMSNQAALHEHCPQQGPMHTCLVPEWYNGTNVMIEKWSRRVKLRRLVLPDGSVVMKKHDFLVVPLDKFSQIATSVGLNDHGLDLNPRFYIYRM